MTHAIDALHQFVRDFTDASTADDVAAFGACVLIGWDFMSQHPEYAKSLLDTIMAERADKFGKATSESVMDEAHEEYSKFVVEWPLTAVS